MLVNGHWDADWNPVQKKDKDGRFVRQTSQFRERLSPSQVKAVAEGKLSLTLYVAYICPWATRTLIARGLLGLQDYIDVKVVDPRLSDQGWCFSDFDGATPASEMDISHIHALYTQSDAHYTGRATVPVLWDDTHKRILNNESADILEVLNHDLRPLHSVDCDLCPEPLRSAVEAFCDDIYESLNNGVYKAGFASSQQAYEEAFEGVFNKLDALEVHFSQQPFAVGEQLTFADIRLFVTLVRFDVAYVGLFKTNQRTLLSYPALSGYLERLLEIPAFAHATRVDHIKAGYYSIKALNPGGLVPQGPVLPWFSQLPDGHY